MLPHSEAKPAWKYLNPADLKRLHNLKFAAKLVVEGFFHGQHRSPYHDFSAEFADYRPYVPGDEPRAIDWRAFARTDRLYIKLYRKETDMNCMVVVDKSNSMAYRGATEVTKLDYASQLAGSLVYLMIKQGDKAGLAVCDDLLREFIPPGSTNQTLNQVLSTLEKTRPGGTTRLAEALRALSGIVRRKGLLIVISDFLDATPEVFSALSMFVHKGFSVLLFQTLTDEELDLPDVGNAIFSDMEGPLKVTVETDSIRAAYQEEIAAFIRDMEANAKARRIHYQLAPTSQPYHNALETFLTARMGGA